MAKQVWRVKLVAEFEAGDTTEVEVARIERDWQVSLAGLGLRLSEAKQLTAAIQAEMAPVQLMIAGKAVFNLEAAIVAPELAYVTARYAALALFGKVADLLSELLAISGAPNASTVRNRTMHAGKTVAHPHAPKTAALAMAPQAKPVIVGLDGGYVRSRPRMNGISW